MYTVIKVAAIAGVAYLGVRMLSKKDPIRRPVIKSVTTVNNPFDASMPISVASSPAPGSAGVRT